MQSDASTIYVLKSYHSIYFVTINQNLYIFFELCHLLHSFVLYVLLRDR